MNDACFRQDYLGRLKPSTLTKLLDTVERYDAKAMFETQTKGLNVR